MSTRNEEIFSEGMALVKIADLPRNHLAYILVDGALWVAATQWGDHNWVGNQAREDLIKELEKRITIEQIRRDLRD